jgi:putative peptidoglycan lipid II flippase
MTDDLSLDPFEPAEEAAAAPARRLGASTTRALATAGLLLTASALISRILGYVRYVVIARAVPDTDSVDAFFSAFRIPDFLFQLVAAGALAAGLIPVLAGLFATGEDARAWRVASTISTLILGALLLLTGLVYLAAPTIVPAITPGFGEAKMAATISMSRIMVLAPLFMAAAAVATSILNAQGRFGATAAAPIVYNLSIIGGALWLVPVMGVEGLAAGVVIGSALHLLVQVPGLVACRARLRPLLDLADTQTRRALYLLGPRALGLGATQLVFLVMTSLGSSLETGSISVFNYAFAILQIPIGVIGVPLGIVLLPSLSREAALGGVETFRRLLLRALGLLAWVMLATTAIGIVLAGDVARLLFGFADISAALLALTGSTLAVFLVGLTAHSLIAVLARAFYALQDTATPVAAAIVAVVVNVVVGVALVGPLGLAGLATAIAAGAWIEVVVLMVLLERRMPGLGLGSIWSLAARSLVAAGVGAAVAFVVTRALEGLWGAEPGMLLVLSRATLATGLGGIVLVGVSLALRIEEPRAIAGLAGGLLRRRAPRAARPEGAP